MKALKLLWIPIIGLVFVVGCSDNNNNKEVAPMAMTQVNLFLKTTSTYVLDPLNPTLGWPLSVLKINIGDIELYLDDNSDGLEEENNYVLYAPDLFEGPFLIDLLSKESFSGQMLGTAEIPNGIFEQIEVSFEQYQGDEDPDVLGYSIFGKGTYQGKSIVIQSDRVGSVDIESVSKIEQTLNGEAVRLVVNFDMDRLIESLLSMDAATVKDDNGNGIIEINTTGTDGNELLANSLVDALENSFQIKVEPAD